MKYKGIYTETFWAITFPGGNRRFYATVDYYYSRFGIFTIKKRKSVILQYPTNDSEKFKIGFQDAKKGRGTSTSVGFDLFPKLRDFTTRYAAMKHKEFLLANRKTKITKINLNADESGKYFTAENPHTECFGMGATKEDANYDCARDAAKRWRELNSIPDEQLDPNAKKIKNELNKIVTVNN